METSVNDQAAWEQAIAAARKSYTDLPHGIAGQLNDVLDQIMQLKQNLVEQVTAAGSSRICRGCGGECCRLGRYHVSVLDILVYLKNDTALPIPDFSTTPACPYSDDSGCIMQSGYRPMTCVVFNCQQVENQLAPDKLEAFHACEQELRDAITRAGQITGLPLNRALLLSCS